jgi:hypothetical protein
MGLYSISGWMIDDDDGGMTIGRGDKYEFEENLLQFHILSATDLTWLGFEIEPGPQVWKAIDKPPELWHSPSHY